MLLVAPAREGILRAGAFPFSLPIEGSARPKLSPCLPTIALMKLGDGSQDGHDRLPEPVDVLGREAPRQLHDLVRTPADHLVVRLHRHRLWVVPTALKPSALTNTRPAPRTRSKTAFTSQNFSRRFHSPKPASSSISGNRVRLVRSPPGEPSPSR